MTTGISSSLPPTLYSRVQWFTVDFYLKAVVGYLSGFPKSHLRIKAQTQRTSNFSYLFAGKNSILGQVLPSSKGRQSREERNVFRSDRSSSSCSQFACALCPMHTLHPH